MAHRQTRTPIGEGKIRGDRMRGELRRALGRLARRHEAVAVMVIDLDRLHEINSVFGYETGDRLLQALSERLTALPADDLVAMRISGDRFIVLLPADPADPAACAEATLHRLSLPVAVGGIRLIPQASAGFAVFPQDGEEFDQLLRRAELALDVAKRHGGDRTLRFDLTMEASLAHRRRLECELERALRCDEFDLVYQPQFTLTDGQVVGVEALLRWPRRPGGPLSPAVFVPIAEACGLIRAIGAWIVRRAARTAQHWHEAGHPIPVSINVSVAQLRQQDVASLIGRALKRHRLPPELLEIEVTESLFVDPAQSAIAGNIAGLARLGVGLAIDDFGTGYSSLAYLKRLPARRIKVDRIFVDGVARDATDAALMRSIVGLGSLFGKRVLAEGVETLEQRQILEREGCHEAQGFLFARPMPEQECAAFLAGAVPNGQHKASLSPAL
jgi:diguanylate cyclase (GGDEF)-like protein